MRLVLLSDTHVPRRARDLPAEVWSAVETADVVFHAGDWVTRDLVDELSGRAARLIGCFGNNDGPDVRAVMPKIVRVTLNGVRFVVVHETGAAQGRDRRMAAAYPDADVLVFGHSHIPWDTTVRRSTVNPPSRSAPGPEPPDVAAPDAAALDEAALDEAARGAEARRPGPLRLLNPGSPTDRRRQPAGTYLTAQVTEGQLINVVLHALPHRS